MKKIFLASALALFGAVNAQEYKSGNGDVTVDFGLTGGLGNTGVNLSESRGGITPGGVLKEDISYLKEQLLEGLLQ